MKIKINIMKIVNAVLKFPFSFNKFKDLVKKYDLKETVVYKHGQIGYDPECLANYTEMNDNDILHLLDAEKISGFVISEMAFTPSSDSNILHLLGAEFTSFYGDQGGTVFTINKCDYDSYIETKNSTEIIGAAAFGE